MQRLDRGDPVPRVGALVTSDLDQDQLAAVAEGTGLPRAPHSHGRSVRSAPHVSRAAERLITSRVYPDGRG
jgi:hypothetical protein